jgi:hypothetical protein
VLAGILLMAILSAEPPKEDTRASCDEQMAVGEFEEESLLSHPYWREWVAGAYYHHNSMGLYDEGMQLSFVVVNELPATPPRFRAPLALPPPLTGELTMTLPAPVRKREGLACTRITLYTDPDRPKLRRLMMEEPALEFRAQVWNAGLPVLDVTWEGNELIYSEEDPGGRRILAVPHPPTPATGYQDGIRILLGDARHATVLLERPPAASNSDEASDFANAREDLLSSLEKLGLSWEKLLQTRPPERVSSAWRQLVLELISHDLSGTLDPSDPALAEKARRLEGLTAIKVDARAEPLWHPLLRAWVARLRPPASKPRPPLGQVELSIVPSEKHRTNGNIEEVWLDGRRILCPACPDPAFQGITTRAVDVPPERAARLWMRWKNVDGVHESEDWVPLLPGTRYHLRYAWFFRSASEQGGTVHLEPQSSARGEQPACLTVEAESQAAPGLGWADIRSTFGAEVALPRVRATPFGTLQPVAPGQILAILPARGDTVLTYGLWTLLPVRYLHAGTYRFMLERDGAVRLRFSPERADCKPARGTSGRRE